MSKLLTRHLPLVRFIATADPKQAVAILKTLTNDQIKVLSEISDNTLNGHVDLSAASKARLRRYKLFLTRLASKKKPLRAKKTLLIRGVRALTLLLETVLPVVERLVLARIS
jgi:hypothetical protein